MPPTTAWSTSVQDNVPTLSSVLEPNGSELVWSYGSGFFQSFAATYEPAHLPLSVMICLFGIVANTLNVIVLTRPSMATPTNVLLTGLSIAQLLLLMNYLLLLTFNICASSCLIPVLHSYSAMTYKWINVNISVAFHTTALIHTLVLSIFRFLAVQTPAFARARLTMGAARACVFSLYSVVPFLCSPTFFTSRVAKVNPSNTRSATSVCNLDDAYDLDYVSHAELLEAAMWMFGIFFKLVPSLAISILSLYLIISLKRYQQKKARLTRKGLVKQFERHEYRPLLTPSIGILLDAQPAEAARPQADTPAAQDCIANAAGARAGAGAGVGARSSAIGGDRDSPSSTNAASLVKSLSINAINTAVRRKKLESKTANIDKGRHNKVTKMLVTVALLCVSVELPHGIINLLMAIFGQSFGMEVYDNLGDFFEMLTLLYSSVNFVLYCIISTEFQRTFKQLFLDSLREAVARKLSRKGSQFQTSFTTGRIADGAAVIANPSASGWRIRKDKSVQTSTRK